MDTAVLMEIENLRRASMASLREKFREVFRKKRDDGTGNICSGGMPGVCRHWPKEISPNGLARGRDRAGCQLGNGQMWWCSQFCSCRAHPGSTSFNRAQHAAHNSLIRKSLICIAFAERLITALGAGGRAFKSPRPDQ